LATAFLASALLAGPANATFTVANPPSNDTILSSETLDPPTAFACRKTGSTEVRLSWTASADSVWADSYRVQRKIDAGAWADYGSLVTGGSATAFTDTAATGASTYTYRVKTKADNNWFSTTTAEIAHTACATPTISTIAKDTDAATVKLNSPHGIAVDSSTGDLYIADTSNHRIRKWTASTGTVSTIIGNGTGACTATQVKAPEGVFFYSGQLYIADTGNHAIRRSDPDGSNLTTIASGSCGTSGFAGDGSAATNASTRLNSPVDVVVNSSGVVYFSDSTNHRLRRFTVGGNIDTVAGDGGTTWDCDGTTPTACNFQDPNGLGIDSTDRIYTAHATSARVSRFVDNPGATPDTVTTVAGNGTAGYINDGVSAVGPSGRIDAPEDVVVEADNDFYIAERGSHRIRFVSGSGTGGYTNGSMYTVGGNGLSGYTGEGYRAIQTRVNSPRSLALRPNGSLLFADTSNNSIRELTAHGNIIMAVGSDRTTGTTDGTPGASAMIYSPAKMAVDSSGNIYIADPVGHVVRKYWADTGEVANIAGVGTAGSAGDTGGANDAQLNTPSGVAVAANGDVYIADTGNNRIRIVTAATGIITTYAGGLTTACVSPATCGNGGDKDAAVAMFNSPSDVALDSSGNVYVSDSATHTIRKINAATEVITTYAGSLHTTGTLCNAGNAAAANLNAPLGIDFDPSNNLYIADGTKVCKVDTAGTPQISTFAGSTACLSEPCGDGGVATSGQFKAAYDVDAGASEVYIADVTNHKVRRVTSGVITTVAGNASAGHTGDGGAATSANVGNAWGVVAYGSDIYIAQQSDWIRKVIGPV
jgi:sugar lactone lactonase YvrE